MFHLVTVMLLGLYNALCRTQLREAAWISALTPKKA